MKPGYTILCIIFLFVSGIVFPQQKRVNDLLQKYKEAKLDTGRINLMIELSREFSLLSQTDSAIYFAQRAIHLSKSVKADKLYIHSCNNLGNIYSAMAKGDSAKLYYRFSLHQAIQNDETAQVVQNLTAIGDLYNDYVLKSNDTALLYYKEALKHALLLNDTIKLIKAYGNVSALYYHLGNIPEASYANQQALKLAESKNDSLLITYSLITYSAILTSVDMFDDARQQIRKSLRFIDVKNDSSLLAQGLALVFMGWSFERENRTDSLFFYANKLLPIAEKAGIAYWIYGVSYWFGFYFNSIDQPEKAIYHFKKALAGIQHEDPNSGSTFHRGLGVSYRKLKNYQESEKHLKESIRLAYLINEKGEISEGHKELFILYNSTGRYKEAINAMELHKRFSDSWMNSKAIGSVALMKYQYEEDKKAKEILLLSSENKLKSVVATKHKQERNFAYAGIVMVVIAGCYFFYRYRQRKRIQSQQAIMTERLRISRELHDEVGATLSGISMYSHLAKEQIKTAQKEEVERSLNIMQQSSGEMVNKLNDIVWLINPEQDTLQKLIERLEEYATDMAAIKNMKVKITVPDKIAEISLPIDSRRNIYLFCKEAINNAVKYSQGSLLELSIKESDNKLEFSISDNEKGFDAVMVKRGNGLENMQKRADEIGAKLILHSKLNEGALVSMQCKIT